MTTTAAFIPFGNSAPKITKELAFWLNVILTPEPSCGIQYQTLNAYF
jgi:hypothetical protein